MFVLAFSGLAVLLAGCGGGGGGGGGRSVGQVLTPTVPVGISTPTLPDGVVGLGYTTDIVAANGLATRYEWSVIAGALPPGLTLAATGVPSTRLAGTPTAPGTYNFTVLVRDGAGFTDVESYSLIVNAGLAISTASLPTAVSGTAYSVALAAAAGSGTGYQWSVVGGALPGGLTLSSGGTLSGTPTASGSFNVTIQVRDSAGATAQRAFTLVVNAPMAITTTTLPVGTQGNAYSATVNATGGTGANYLWTRAAGALPGGVVFSPRGTPATAFSGTPTAAGSFTFTVEVTDASGSKAQQAFTIDINPPVVISTAALATGVVGTPYNAAIQASGGTNAGYAWTLDSGALPPGLTLGATGTPATALSGTPTTQGSYSFTIRATDSNGGTGTKALTMTVNPALDITTTGALAGGAVGVPYADRLVAVEGTKSGYAWDIASGALPAGITLSAAGTPAARLSGTPASAGNFAFRARVTDSSGSPAVEDLTLNIAPASATLTMVTRVLPAATTGTAYSRTLAATGGSGTLTWSAPGGLPAGFTLSPAGLLEGTPADTGVSLFTVRVTDGTAIVERELSLEAKAPHAWVAYVADQRVDSRTEIFFTNVAGATPGTSASARSTWLAAADVAPSDSFSKFSPDGRKLAFRCDLDTDFVDELYVVELTGTTSGQAVKVSGALVTGGDITNFVWSPDSKKLLFNADAIVDNDTELFMVDVSGATPGARQKINGQLAVGGDIPLDNDGAWAFSPDSRKVAYKAEQNLDNCYELFVVDVSGATPGAPQQVNTALPDPANDDIDSFAWVSPDALIYFGEQTTTGVNELYFCDVGGAAPAAPVKVSPSLASGEIDSFSNVYLSPDGGRVAFVGDLTTVGVNEIYLVDLSGAAPSAAARLNIPYVLGHETPTALAWSPDGNRLAYLCDEQTNAVDELMVIELSGPIAGRAQIASAGGTDVATFGWSPDSRRLAYRDGAADTELFAIDMSAALPGNVHKVNTALPAGGDVTQFLFSPDSQKIAYRADQTTDEVFDLHVVTLGVGGAAPGASLRANDPLVTNGDVASGVNAIGWSRDASRLYYLADERADNVDELFQVTVTGTFPFGSVKVSGTMVSGGDVNTPRFQD